MSDNNDEMAIVLESFFMTRYHRLGWWKRERKKQRFIELSGQMIGYRNNFFFLFKHNIRLDGEITTYNKGVPATFSQERKKLKT